METLVPKDVTAALKLIEQETMRMRSIEHRLHSVHEGFAYLVDHVDDLFTQVKAHPRDWTNLRLEAVRIAAVSVRFILDITDVDDTRRVNAIREAGFLPSDDADGVDEPPS